MYETAATLAAMTYLVLRSALQCRPDLLLDAVRDNTVRTASNGIYVHAAWITTRAASGLLAGLAHGVLTFIVGSVAPPSLNWLASGAIRSMAVLSGVGMVAKPLLEAMGYTLFKLGLSQGLSNDRLGMAQADAAIAQPDHCTVLRARTLSNPP